MNLQQQRQISIYCSGIEWLKITRIEKNVLGKRIPLTSSISHEFNSCRIKPKGSICLYYKWADTAFLGVGIDDREVASSASDRQGLNFESCVWRAASSHLSHHPHEVLLVQFSLYDHKGGLKPHPFFPSLLARLLILIKNGGLLQLKLIRKGGPSQLKFGVVHVSCSNLVCMSLISSSWTS